MTPVRRSPGPDAARAYRFGIVSAALVGLVTVVSLYWAGELTAYHAGFTLLALFPVYLVFVAAALSRWLGYHKGVTDLQPADYGQERTGPP